MTKPTEGPYAAITRQGSWNWVVYCRDDPNTEICQMFHDGTHLNQTGEANARLLAASWEMREALEKCHDTLDALCMSGNMHLVSAALPDGFGMDTIRALLARIEGETE